LFQIKSVAISAIPVPRRALACARRRRRALEGIHMSRFAIRLARILTVACALGAGAASALPVQTPLSGTDIPKFVDALPTFAGQRVGGPLLFVNMRETTQKALPASFYATLPAPYKAGTVVWGYQVTGLDANTFLPVSRPPSWPGVTVEAQRNVPTTVIYTNNLTTPTLQAELPVDQTLNWADPKALGCDLLPVMSAECKAQYAGPVPTVVHLHGSEVPPAFDGGPEAWFTPTGLHGPNYSSLLPVPPNSAMYRYPNAQEATALWFHDHALGTTRLNVYGGIAAFYLLRDAQDTGRASNPLKLPAGGHELELVIQDRSFDTNGQLLYQDPTQISNPSVHPFWRPEFFGDVVTVNGKTWPKLAVEPRRYRFRILNGSNARFYNLMLAKAFGPAATPPLGVAGTGLQVTSPGPVMWQIGTDGGRLDRPAAINSLLIAPGERADIIVDFSSVAGTQLTLVNDANAPFPDGDAVDVASTGQVMQFNVARAVSSADATCNPAATGAAACQLRPGNPIVRLSNPATGTVAPGVTVSAKRQLILKEIAGADGPLGVVLNNTKFMGTKESTLTTALPVPVADSVGVGDTWVTEAPRVGSTEVWEVSNLTVDGHPIHLHLVQFQVLSRQDMNTGEDANGNPVGYAADWEAAFPGGVFAPGDGPPRPYLTPNADRAVGGNPAFSRYLLGTPRLPAANEAGWKDTVVMYPGQVTRLAVRWAPQTTAVARVSPGVNLYPFDPTLTNPKARDASGNPGAAGYLWHCHILEHEDNDMMRPYAIAR
jgi:spore coat protein A, manganese oxidase